MKNLLLGEGVECAHCKRRRATVLDHYPPLAMHAHREGTGCCRLIPSCAECNRIGGVAVMMGTWRPGMVPVADDLEPERAGLEPSDDRWSVPWLEDLHTVPADATWPRLMSVPHERAVGSLEPEFSAFAGERTGKPLRWWQRLAAARLLEIDGDGRLVWEAAILTLARQLGKSWLLRELCLWRMLEGERFGEPQDVLHTGKDMAICKEVQRPARYWAKAEPHRFKVREVNGQEEIEHLADGSRWMLRAKDAVYGYSASLAAADEAWKVRQASIEEGLVPTMAEREQSQLLLVSTAHRMATQLMLGRRAVCLDQLESGGGDLLIEWSAPAGTDLEDRDGWRLASPHWTERRERLIAKRLELARSGELEDPDEPDPVESFKSQWLNQWPKRRSEPAGATEPLLSPGVWDGLSEPQVRSQPPLWLALEDDYGNGAAVGACARTEDGRFELDGWLRADWDTAIADALALAAGRPLRSLVVGAALVAKIPLSLPEPRPMTSTATRTGLSLLRDLAGAGRLCHDTTPELDKALEAAHVREAPSGLFLVARGQTHLVRAAVWALAAAHKPAPVPAIH